MQRTMRLVTFSLSAVALMVLVGCGGAAKPIPVTGKIALGSGVLAKGNVVFHPDSAKGNKNTITPTGTCENGMYKMYTNGVEGAPPGWYKVTVTASVPSNPKDEYSVPVSLINESYNTVEKTSISLEVKEGAAAGSYDFAVTK